MAGTATTIITPNLWITCSYCGYSLQYGWNFCPKCGNKITTVTPEPHPIINPLRDGDPWVINHGKEKVVKFILNKINSL